MRYYPVYLDLEKATVLIAGGGETALQKLRLLAKTDACIVLVASTFHDEIIKFAAEFPRIELIERAFETEDVQGKRLVYAAHDDEAMDDLVCQAANQAGILVNHVDHPDDCDFITPSIVDRDPITIAIGTEGTAPLLAREIKASLDRLLPANYGALGTMAKKIRPLILAALDDGRARLRLWERLMQGAFRQSVLADQLDKAEEVFQSELSLARGALEGDETSTAEKTAASRGSVTLVGAGPGDPDLLTLKALHHLQGADVLVVDRLVNPEILDYARRDARRIFVGKQAGAPSISQEEINQILVREALTGARVVRVKGGDPNIFGRVQEELAACQLMGIEVEVVPGLSAAQAASAAIQLPLTHRGTHRSITFITAATKDQVVASDILAFMKAGRPFAVYMGIKLAGEMVQALGHAGVDMNADVIIVENASLKTERAFATPLKSLEAAIQHHSIDGPAILFFGLSYEEMGLTPAETVKRLETSNIVPLNRQAG